MTNRGRKNLSYAKVLALLILVTFFYVFNNEQHFQYLTSLNTFIPKSATAKALNQDLEKVTAQTVAIANKSQVDISEMKSIIARSASSVERLNLSKDSNKSLHVKKPSKLRGSWHKIEDNAIIPVDSNVQEIQYAFFDFSKESFELDPRQNSTEHKITPIDQEFILKSKNRTSTPSKSSWNPKLNGWFDLQTRALTNQPRTQEILKEIKTTNNENWQFKAEK